MSRPALLALVVALSSLPAVGPAAAQTGSCSNLDDTKRAGCLAVVEASRRAENGAVERTPWSSGVALIAGRDASHAKLTLAPGDGSTKWIASVTTPIQKGDPTTELATLNGLAEDIEIAVSRKSTLISIDDLDRFNFFASAERKDKICQDHGLDPGCTATDLENALRKKGVGPVETARVVSEFEMFVTGSQDEIPLLQAVSIRQWEIGASVGRSERDSFTSDGEVDEEDRASYSFGGSYGQYFGSNLVKLDARWQRKFQPQQTVSRCTPVDGSPALERCKDLPLGRAEREERLPLSLEVRRWNLVGGVRWAMSPRVTYDAEQELWAASLPLYLVPDADGNLTGGLSVDWREDQDVVFSVFVSAPLSFF